MDDGISNDIISTYFFTASEGVLGKATAMSNPKDTIDSIIWNNSTFADTQLYLITFCVVVLRNGIIHTGESIHYDETVLDTNFQQYQRHNAYQNAIAKIPTH